MQDKFKNLQVNSLDKKFAKFKIAAKPRDGWIKTIRTALSMPASFLAKKLKVSQQTIAKFEQNEVDEVITISSLRKIAEAMDCEFHYILVPRAKSLKKIIQKQALKKAKILVSEVDKTMILEDQKVSNSSASIKRLAKDLEQNLNHKLWQENA